MKILRVISFGFQGGGAETGIVEVDNILKKRGNRIKVISSDAHSERKYFSDYQFKSINPNNPLKIVFHLLNVSAFITVRKVLRAYKPDIVHLHTMGEVSPLVILLFKNIPIVMTIHGPEFFIPKLLIWLLKKDNFKDGRIDEHNLNIKGKINYFYFRYIQGTVYKYILRKINLFILHSKYTQKITNNALKPNKVIYNGIKLLPYKEMNNSHNLLYVGRLEMYKGVEYAIKAMPQILKKYPDTHFSIVGEGSYKENLINLTKNFHLQNNIHFVGWVDHEKIEDCYEQASIVLMPSYWPEAFGKSGVEAMSKGRPVIASKVGGITEWLQQGKTGFLVEPKNSDQIARCVIKLFKDRDLLNNMSKNARKKAEQFSIEKYADNIEKTYFKLIDEFIKIKA